MLHVVSGFKGLPGNMFVEYSGFSLSLRIYVRTGGPMWPNTGCNPNLLVSWSAVCDGAG